MRQCYYFVINSHYNNVSLKREICIERKNMKISKVLQNVVKKEGKRSATANILVKYQNSKEFSYLVDIQK